MHTKKNIQFIFFLAMTGVILFSCTKSDEYKKYTEGGEIIYTGRVDSVRAYPGNNRIRLSMILLSDPKITKVKVYWNNRSDSAVKPVTRGPGIDTIYFMLNNMAEGTHAFEIFTYDNDGHSSIRTDAIGRVYGQNYINSLFNRPLKSVVYKGDSTQIKWFSPSSQTIGQEINYLDSIGNVPRSAFAAKADTMTTLYRIRRLSNFQYRTLYKPDPASLDTFYSNYQSVQVQ
jgi:hypothetical protein